MFDVLVEKRAGYTELVCRGPASLKSFKELFDEIVKGTYGHGDGKKYLIDLRQIEGTIPTVDRYELGEYMAEKISDCEISSISKKETYNKVGENVAVNRGAKVFSTDDENQAREWILAH
ncbi:MAG: hypothetical protein ABI036_19565 [Fibrobacteria bacterium]